MVNDLVVAMIVTIMLIPQSLAHALLAGLTPQVGWHRIFSMRSLEARRNAPG